MISEFIVIPSFSKPESNKTFQSEVFFQLDYFQKLLISTPLGKKLNKKSSMSPIIPKKFGFLNKIIQYQNTTRYWCKYVM